MSEKKSDLSLITDKIDQLIITMRSQPNSSFQAIASELSQKIQAIDKKLVDMETSISDLKGKIQPVVDVTSASRIVGTTFRWIAGTILAGATVWAFFKEIVKTASK